MGKATGTGCPAANDGSVRAKFKPKNNVVVVVPECLLVSGGINLNGITIRQGISLLQVLIALHLSNTPFDWTIASEYDDVSSTLTPKGTSCMPLPFVHYRPKDLLLFDAASTVRFLVNGTPAAKDAAESQCSVSLERALNAIIAHFELCGAKLTSDSTAAQLVRELNAAFSASLIAQVLTFAVLARIPVDETLLNGQVNSWLLGMPKMLELSGPTSWQLEELLMLSRAANSVSNSVSGSAVDRSASLPVRPCSSGERRNILITAALPYVNNVPHLGNIIGAVLSGDVYARYCRLAGHQTLYICGTDEYGTATETKAMQEGLACQALCDKYFREHAAVYKWFDINFDAFGRTPTKLHTEIVHEVFEPLYANGFFFEQSVDQCFCNQCQCFRPDRYVEGKCPLCGFDDARGDQCDGCGKLLNAVELIEPRCKMCGSGTVVQASKHLFLDLSKLQPEVEKFVDEASKEGFWSSNSVGITKAWLQEGLKPRCMTRDLKWGTSVPVAGYENKVFYVWFDAPIGYISITANYDPEGWRQWWKASRDTQGRKVELVQFMGKDNVPFHTVMFPATLLGTRQPWTMLHHISTTEYLNYEGGKFSKSRCTGVFGNDARDSNIPASLWRYYLLATRPETTDAAFSWSDFVGKANGELLANLGNFVNRTARFVVAKLGGIVPAARLLPADEAFIADKIDSELAKYAEDMESVHLRSGLRAMMAVSAAGNLYLTEQRLDNKLLVADPERCGTVLAVALNIVYTLSALIEPFMPAISRDICTILCAPSLNVLPRKFSLLLTAGQRISMQPFHLFEKVDEALVEQLRIKFAGKDGTGNAGSVNITEAAAGKKKK